MVAVEGQLYPAGQAVQFVEPADNAMYPVGQIKHCDTDACPVRRDAVPAGHGSG